MNGASSSNPLHRYSSLWLHWWHHLSFKEKVLPISLATLYIFLNWALGGLRNDLVIVPLVTTLLYYLGPGPRQLISYMLPCVLVGMVYDSMKYYGDYLRSTVHVDEPYLLEKKLFGIATPEGILTPNEWWQNHTHAFLDLITGFSYITFVLIFMITTLYFGMWLTRTGTKKRSPMEIQSLAPQIPWSFFLVNVLGYTNYYWYPAAPPWYVTEYGLGPANMNAHASAAGAVRFDALLGTSFFTEMYGRSNDVFGAIPSLHIAYPLLTVYFAFRFGVLRTFSVVFFLTMCFAAVYLNHHYIVDILAGMVYTVITLILTHWIFKRKPA